MIHKLSHRKVYDLINAFEASHEVDGLTYQGHSLWPLFRSSLICYLTLDIESQKYWVWPTALRGLVLQVIAIFLTPLLGRNLILGKHIYIQNIGAKKRSIKDIYDDPFFLSLKWILKKEDIDLRRVHLDSRIFTIMTFRHYWQSHRKVENYRKQIKWLVKKFCQNSNLELESLLLVRLEHDLFRFFRSLYFFEKIAKLNAPKFVYFTAYYMPTFMAASFALKNRGAKTVEVQHGQQGKYSIVNIWSRIPRRGYILLPSLYWLWGERSLRRKRFLLDREGGCDYLIGGHPVLLYATHHGVSRDSSLVGGRVIFAAQPLRDSEMLPGFVLEALRELGVRGYKVGIRLHPRSLHRIDDLVDLVGKDIDVIETSTEPLYEQMCQTLALITLWSSVAYEAKALGAKVIIASEIGRDLMLEDIESGAFSYVKNKNEILSVIQSSDKVTNISDFMEMNESIIRNNIRNKILYGDGK